MNDSDQDSDSIFSVEIEKTNAELEVSDSSISCVSGETTHFDFTWNELRAYIQSTHKTILFNFYKNNQLFKAVISSKYCIRIMKHLDYHKTKTH